MLEAQWKCQNCKSNLQSKQSKGLQEINSKAPYMKSCFEAINEQNNQLVRIIKYCNN